MRAARRLYEFTRKLSALVTLDDVAEGAASEIHTTLGRPSVVLLDQGGRARLARGLAARGRPRYGQPEGGTLGLRPRRARGHRHPTRFRLSHGISCRSGRRAASSASSASARTRKARRSIRKPASCSTRWPTSRRRRWNARARPRDGRSRTRRDRDRAGAQHAARLDLARFPHAAVVDPRLGHQPDRLWRQARPGARSDLLGQDPRARPKASTGWCATCWRSRGIDAGALELRRDWIDLARDHRAHHPLAARRGAGQAHFRREPAGRSIRWSAPTRRWSSRRSAT